MNETNLHTKPAGLNMERAEALYDLVYNVFDYAIMNDMVMPTKESAENFYRKVAHYIYLNIVSRGNLPGFNLYINPEFKLNEEEPYVEVDELKRVKDVLVQNQDKDIRYLDYHGRKNLPTVTRIRGKFNMFELRGILKKIMGIHYGYNICWYSRDPMKSIKNVLNGLEISYSDYMKTHPHSSPKKYSKRLKITDYSDIPEMYALIFLILIPNKELFMECGIIEAMKNPKFFYPLLDYEVVSDVYVERIVEVYCELHDIALTVCKTKYEEYRKEGMCPKIEILLRQLKRWYPINKKYVYLTQQHYY